MGRKIRILGLHGYGTSGMIFEMQTSSFRRYLQEQNEGGDTFEFDFADGSMDAGPAAGIELFYSPPYYCWWPNPGTLEDMVKGRERLKTYIKENGPYDGLIMFSQGCTLGSSLLLEHFKETPHDPPPFKFAIFICGGPSLQQLETEFGYTIDPKLWELDRVSRLALARRADAAAILAYGSDRWKNDINDVTDLSMNELVQLARGTYQINIPTVHVVGSKDPRGIAGHLLHAISHPDMRKIYEHDGGHDIPRNQMTSATIARLIRWASSPSILAKAEQINGV